VDAWTLISPDQHHIRLTIVGLTIK